MGRPQILASSREVLAEASRGRAGLLALIPIPIELLEPPPLSERSGASMVEMEGVFEKQRAFHSAKTYYVDRQ